MFMNLGPLAKALHGDDHPIYETPTEGGNHLVFEHNPQMLTTKVVRMLYLGKMKHIRNKLRCDYNARTSNASRKERY